MEINTWFNLTRSQQIGNIGSEISRAARWEEQEDIKNRNLAIERSLLLIELTLDDPKWKRNLKEIARMHEVMCSKLISPSFFEITLKELENFCVEFVLQNISVR